MIVTIDGPAGAGKSSVAKELARRLGFQFLDTGAMYRAVTLAALEGAIDWNDNAALVDVARRSLIEVKEGRVQLDGKDVSQAIRQTDVTECIHYMADHRGVRTVLVDLQRHFAERHTGIVTEGRDQGTVVFPDAQCKIYLTASAEERARRRQSDLAAQGESIDLEQILDQQNARDDRDRRRPIGTLVQADDATKVITDGMSFEDVVERIESLVVEKKRREKGT